MSPTRCPRTVGLWYAPHAEEQPIISSPSVRFSSRTFLDGEGQHHDAKFPHERPFLHTSMGKGGRAGKGAEVTLGCDRGSGRAPGG